MSVLTVLVLLSTQVDMQVFDEMEEFLVSCSNLFDLILLITRPEQVGKLFCGGGRPYSLLKKLLRCGAIALKIFTMQ